MSAIGKAAAVQISSVLYSRQGTVDVPMSASACGGWSAAIAMGSGAIPLSSGDWTRFFAPSRVEAALRTPGATGEPNQAGYGYPHCGPNGAGHVSMMLMRHTRRDADHSGPLSGHHLAAVGAKEKGPRYQPGDRTGSARAYGTPISPATWSIAERSRDISRIGLWAARRCLSSNFVAPGDAKC
jgi:hypothetical protein